MRRLLIAVLAGLLIGAAMAAPASAGKKKTVKGSFDATLLPFPKLAAWGDPVGLTKPGCSSGQRDVHWAGEEFVAPFNGKLEMESSGFTGDWDLYVFDGEVPLVRSENDQIQGMAPPEESLFIELKKGAAVTLVMCNWLGGPENTASWEFRSK